MVSVSQGVVYVYPSQVPFCHSQVRSRFQWMTKGELYLRIQRLGRIKTTTTVHTEREEGESRWSTIMMADHHEHSRPQAGDRVLGCITRSDGGRRRGSVGRRSSLRSPGAWLGWTAASDRARLACLSLASKHIAAGSLPPICAKLAKHVNRQIHKCNVPLWSFAVIKNPPYHQVVFKFVFQKNIKIPPYRYGTFRSSKLHHTVR